MEFTLENVQQLRQDKSEQATIDNFIEEIKNGILKAAPNGNQYFTSFSTTKYIFEKVKEYFKRLGFSIKGMRTGEDPNIMYHVWLTW